MGGFGLLQFVHYKPLDLQDKGGRPKLIFFGRLRGTETTHRSS